MGNLTAACDMFEQMSLNFAFMHVFVFVLGCLDAFRVYIYVHVDHVRTYVCIYIHIRIHHAYVSVVPNNTLTIHQAIRLGPNHCPSFQAHATVLNVYTYAYIYTSCLCHGST
jgi:hypothetical protein